MFEFGGMTFPAPLSPYPSFDGIKRTILSPKFTFSKPSKKPGINPPLLPY